MTKKYERLSLLFYWLGVITLLAPVIIYTAIGFAEGTITEKISLGMTLIGAIILTALNVLFKTHYRSGIWLVIIGLFFCLESIMPLLTCVAVATILDEFVFTPLHNMYKQKYTINKEIDKRIG